MAKCILLNNWRPKIVCRIIGVPCFGSGIYGGYAIYKDVLQPTIVNGVQFLVMFLVGLFLVTLYRKLEIRSTGVKEVTRYIFWSRHKFVPINQINSINVVASSEFSGGDVGPQSGSNRTANYYDIFLNQSKWLPSISLNYYVLFYKNRDVVQCYEFVQKLASLLSVPIVCDDNTLRDFRSTGLSI